MKSVCFLLLLAFTSTLAHVHFGDYQVMDHPFGAYHLSRVTIDGTESVVYFPEEGLMGHPDHHEDYRKAYMYHKENPQVYQQVTDDVILNCNDIEDKADYLKFFPTYIGSLTPSNSTFNFAAPCFQNNTMTLNIKDSTTVEIIHVNRDASAFSCGDTYYFSTLKNFHVSALIFGGTHKTTFTVTPDELQLVQTTGIMVFRTCDKVREVVPDIIKTAYLFIGEIELATGMTPHNKSIPTKFDTDQAIQFTLEATGYQWVERPASAQNVIVDIDESLVNSGDFFAVKKFDGTGNLVEYGTGSHVNHCTVALRVNGDLYIAESNSNFEWPVGGIQINPYKTWIQWAINQGYQVTWLPLKQEYAQKFNTEAAYAFFQQYQGVPYGIHNYIWGWLDTPDHSYPPVLPPQFFGYMFAFIEKLKPDGAASMFGMAMNKRLGTENLTIAQIAEEAYNRNMTLPDLYGIPEIDGWLYEGNVSYVCSAFVTGVLKAGGLFDGMEVNAVEFTPRDVYQLEFYDPAPNVPDNCKSIDPTNPYCQIMGQYRIEFPGIGSVPAYSHMNEACYSEPPLYARYPDQC